jgi:recombination associated protein RdgC
MALVERIQQKSFLGTEFATWLWYRSESNRGTLEVGDGKTCQMDFEKDLVLTSDYGEATASALKGDAPTLAPEAAAALAQGKKVRRARIRVTLDNVNWSMALNAENFDWGGLKVEIPPSLPFEEALPLRLKALEEFHQLFETLFGRFLDLRLNPDLWEPEERAMRAWVLGKLEAEKDQEAEEEA